MESSVDTELEEMLVRAGKALSPNRTRLHTALRSSLQTPELQPARSTLSPLSLTFFMNTTSKLFVALAVVVVVGGAGVYLSGSSNSAGTPSTNTTGTPQEGQMMENPSLAQASGVPSIDDVTASLQAGMNDQTSALNALDSSASQVVNSVDTGDSSAQPYDASQI